MSPAAAFHVQLASIMEVLANTAVAEICELVDTGYSVLQLENEALRRKVRLMELRAARATASGRARAQPPARHPGNEPRRPGTPGGEAALSRGSSQEPLGVGGAERSSHSGLDPPGTPAAGESAQVTAAVIKVEDDECWSPAEPDEDFCVVDGQKTETQAPPPLTKQEDGGGGWSRSWVSGDVTLNPSQASEPSYDCLPYEPRPQHGSCSTHNPLREDPSCSYALDPGGSVSSDSGSSRFPFTVTEVSPSVAEHQQPAGFQDNQQRAPPSDEPRRPARKEMTERLHSFIRRDRWRPQDGVTANKAFVCNCCGKTLASLKNLKTHMRVHTGEKPFVCALCGKRFSDYSNLKRHQSVHTGEKRYGCVHCGKRFAQSGSLKVHMTVHTDCKQFRCSCCGKTFISGSHLRRHVTVHAGEKRPAAAAQ